MPPKEEKPKKKRGRKPKPKTNNGVKPPPKKRGRKPKGGKIVTKIDIDNKDKKKTIPNVILHLKCSTKDIIQDSISKIEYNPTLENIEAYNKEDNLKVNELDDISSQNNTNIFDNKSFLQLNNNTVGNAIISEKKTMSKTSKKKRRC